MSGDPGGGSLLFHLDADAFFASVEQRERPELAGRPVIVGGDPRGRGVVAAASYEARKYGVRSAMPVAVALRRAPQAVRVPVRHPLYSMVSRRLFKLAAGYARQLERISIDEAYLRPIPGDPHDVAQELREAVRRQLHLPVSIGMGANKFLAKTATSLAKPDGLARLERDQLPALLWPRPLTAIHGIGEATARRWRRCGLERVGDLARKDRGWVRRVLGEGALVAWSRAQGIDRRQLGEAPVTRSVSRETTFARDRSQRAAVMRTLARLAESVAGRLRQKGYRASTVTLKLRYGDYTTRTHAVTPGHPFLDDAAVWRLARDLLAAHWQGEPLRLVGISLGGLVAAHEPRQLSLLPEDAAEVAHHGAAPPRPRSGREALDERLARAVDEIRRQHGRRAIHLAASMSPD